VVACRDAHGKEIARGLVNYAANDTRRILRHSSAEIEAILGFVEEPELIHRDNLVVLG
jgi:glutamate 5-kinase